uniref:Uncharacterized protein n=1 Tax=Physcomitrium patens TaxID=3218 RepID=A0A7I3Z1C4_PHYPA
MVHSVICGKSLPGPCSSIAVSSKFGFFQHSTAPTVPTLKKRNLKAQKQVL